MRLSSTLLLQENYYFKKEQVYYLSFSRLGVSHEYGRAVRILGRKMLLFGRRWQKEDFSKLVPCCDEACLANKEVIQGNESKEY